MPDTFEHQGRDNAASFRSPLFRSQLADLFRMRRDVRRFRSDPVAPDRLDRLLVAAHSAPSVGLSQPWRFVIVEAADRRAAVLRAFEAANARARAAQDADRRSDYARLKLAGLAEAPVHLAVYVERDPAQGHALGRATMPETVAYSAVLAIHTLWLAAVSEGLGLGWVSILDPTSVTAALDVPPDWSFVAYLCIGVPESTGDVPELELAGWEHRQPLVVLRR